MWDFLAIVGIISIVILFLTIISGTFSKNKIDTEAFKQSIINEYLEEEKKKLETEKRIKATQERLDSSQKLLDEIEQKRLKKDANAFNIPDDVAFLGDDFLTKEEIAEMRSRKIHSKYFRPKKNADSSHPYYLKKFVITGVFKNFPDRNILAELLYEVGADIDTSISKKIDYVVVGENAGWKKMEQISEYGIKVLSEEDIISFFNLEK